MENVYGLIVDEVIEFLERNFPNVKFIKMNHAIIIDDENKYLYNAKSALMGKKGDSDDVISHNCYNFILQLLSQNPYTSIGIYGLQITDHYDDISRTMHNRSVVLRFALPEKIEQTDDNDEYTSSYMKDINFDDFMKKYNTGLKMKDMKLGILKKNGKIVNHRSFVKVILNPIFRKFGFNIVTLYDTDTERLGMIRFLKCNKCTKIEWNFDNHNEYDCIVKKRIFI